MKKRPVVPKVLAECADPERASNFLELFKAAVPGWTFESLAPERQRILVALFSGSQALSSWLIAHPKYLEMLGPDELHFPRRKPGLVKEVNAWLEPLLEQRDYAAGFRRLREFKQVEMLRIAARDLAGLGSVAEITGELSSVADVCLDGVWRVCLQQMNDRHGTPYQQDLKGTWVPAVGCVLGMGKLGGQELNYSSDVDVLFVYSDEGQVFKEAPMKGRAPRPSVTNHQFFNRLAESFIGEVSRMASEGALYRIDLRLRPEGDGGPLSRSLSSYENYYAQWGQTWERMMLIKARGVAGDEGLAAEFLEMIQPFRYPRSINPGVVREVAAMKDRIETEVLKEGGIERNVKLGRGGIREIEFIAQSMQLLHAGKQPFLQGAQTVPCLAKLVEYEHLQRAETRVLAEAYEFLRKVEHRLQMEDNLQTHTIPTQRPARERLAHLMGCATLKEFEKLHAGHTQSVRAIFEKVLKSDSAEKPGGSPFPKEFEGREGEWKQFLEEHSFREPEKAFRVLREFVEGPGYVHVSPRTVELAFQLLPRLFGRCLRRSRETGQPAGAQRQPVLSDPDRVVTRLDSFIAAYGARGTLFELWSSNPSIFDLLVLLFDRSEFLAELSIRTPDLVDELVTSERLRQRKTAEETLRDLRHGLNDEDQHLWVRKYHQAELMRIGLRDILELADFEQYLAELSALADACLEYCLEVVMRRHKLKKPPFTIIGLGKLGGAEIDYGSDLDIVFVAENGSKQLNKLTKFAVEVMDLLSKRTEQGSPFHTDARLRPDGEKGLLVNTLAAFEEYYRNRAQLWEIQTLTRVRPVAGDMDLGKRFTALAGSLTNFLAPDLPLAAYEAGWKERIHRMRMRIERERTPSGKDDLAIKTGSGGLVDAEFIAQALCLENGWQEPNTLKALMRADGGKLPEGGRLIANYRKLRRVEGILRRWSYEGETVLPDDPAPYRRVAIRCGFPGPDEFRASLAASRTEIRKCYKLYFGV